VFQEYGGWLRPAWYGRGAQEDCVAFEVMAARKSVALFDGSPLGKIEVIGPQAAEFLDFIYYNTVSNLKPGRCRYGFILAESGIVYDDGVLVRIDENRFIVSCSSSHVAGMHAVLEEWRQDRFDRSKVFIHNATAESATLTVSGPKSRQLLAAAGVETDLSDEALPHMATTQALFDGTEIRVTRISFTGDRSYELAVPSLEAPRLWDLLRKAGEPFGATLLGMEALLVLRAEKGYIVIGKDSDGMSRPMDFGLTTPLEKKKVEFVGRRSLLAPEAQRADRKQFVGLEVVDGGGPLATGAHGIEIQGPSLRSIGYVTSSYASPTLDRPIALGLIERGAQRHGEIITVQHLGVRRQARIAPPCAFDPEGACLNA
jgi:sarcosine oxidase subunit alpha